MMLALVSPSISSARLIATAAEMGDRARDLRLLLAERVLGGDPAHSRPTRSPPAESGATSRSATVSVGHSAARPRPAAAPSSAASIRPSTDALDAAANPSGDRGQQLQARAVGREPKQLADLGVQAARACRATSTGQSSAGSVAAATRWASPDRPVSAFTRRRSRS